MTEIERWLAKERKKKTKREGLTAMKREATEREKRQSEIKCLFYLLPIILNLNYFLNIIFKASAKKSIVIGKPVIL